MDTVLLHTCCAPCSLSCIDPLRAEGIEPVAFWYNPNIHPWKEYQARRDCLLEYAPTIGMEVRVQEDYGLREFVRHVADDIDHRCAYCYEHRIEGTGTGLLHAEILRLRVLRAGPVSEADRPRQGEVQCGLIPLYEPLCLLSSDVGPSAG